MRNITVFVVVLTSFAISPWVFAHEPMQHTCSAPERPIDDQNDTAWHDFLTATQTFRRCVNDKMEWHQRAARNHQQLATQVVGEWNAFVRTSLNTAEDFPYPPTEEAE